MGNLFQGAARRKPNPRRHRDGRFTSGDIRELYSTELRRWSAPRGLTTRDRLTVARRYTTEWRR
jgi:hypothetical protein